MGRTRDSLLDGALSVVERDGVRGLTMSSVARRAGVAKATLYNHFRTKDDVLVALVLREVELGGEQARRSPTALAAAADYVADHVAVRWLATTDPGALVPLLRLAPSPATTRTYELVADLLGCAPGDVRADVAVRWLVSQVLAPQSPDDRAATAALLARLARRAPDDQP
jgi:AcrR family transcriptional regulator